MERRSRHWRSFICFVSSFIYCWTSPPSRNNSCPSIIRTPRNLSHTQIVLLQNIEWLQPTLGARFGSHSQIKHRRRKSPQQRYPCLTKYVINIKKSHCHAWNIRDLESKTRFTIAPTWNRHCSRTQNYFFVALWNLSINGRHITVSRDMRKSRNGRNDNENNRKKGERMKREHLDDCSSVRRFSPEMEWWGEWSKTQSMTPPPPEFFVDFGSTHHYHPATRHAVSPLSSACLSLC